ncbi:MAG TPA: hypothetical protein DCR63_04465, partial [Microbacterium sp.]|nr:hypothetical protein [Microbacterium sp.]
GPIGPSIGLGAAETFAILGATTVTFGTTGADTDVDGNIGVSPGTEITGQENLAGAEGVDWDIFTPPSIADQAQADLTAAYNIAAGLTPLQTGLTDLTGLSLVPGVYSGGALSVTGNLTLAGDSESVWVFQAASSLTIASTAQVTVTGGASACNVFWQVASAATIEGGAQFVGTVMADTETITVGDGATIEGRLLARTAAVTLISDTISRPSGCSVTGGTVTSSPTITSAAPHAGTAGTDYSYTVTASGTPAPSYSITSQALPAGLGLDATSGVISGTPTTPGTYTFTVTAANGAEPAASATYTIPIAAPTAAVAAGEQLAESGSELLRPIVFGATLVTAGLAAFLLARSTRMSPRR